MATLDLESLLAERLGFRFDDSLRARLSEVAGERMRKFRCYQPEDYLARLRAPQTGAEELRALAQELTVGETYFFRGRDHFQAFTETVLPERLQARAGTRTLNILSVACASGEEPYTLAILLREAIPDIASWRVDILGVDINAGSLTKARRGVYSPWSLRDVPAEVKSRYFREREGNHLLNEEIRSMVRFEERNVVDDSELWQPGRYDVIFCRNMLIYFTLDAMTGVLNRIERALVPGGYLFVGHSESLRGLTRSFHLRSTHDTFYYQVLAEGEERPAPSIWDPPVTQDLWSRAPPPTGVAPWAPGVPVDTSWVEAIQKSSDRIADLSAPSLRALRASALPREGGEEKLSPLPRAGEGAPKGRERGDLMPQALELFRQERYEDVAALVRGQTTDAMDPQALILLGTALVNRGQVREAEEVCRRVLAADELNAEADYVLALCREHEGDIAGAIRHAQTAGYLDSGFGMPHLLLGRLARRQNDRATAKRELMRALELLAREDSTRTLLFGGGFGRETLMQICRTELAAT